MKSQSSTALCWQVLSRESLTRRCYWEVESRARGVKVAVTYENEEHQCRFEMNARGETHRGVIIIYYTRAGCNIDSNLKVPLCKVKISGIGCITESPGLPFLPCTHT